ncbi:hypothetical protein L1987_58623 [Smallanthus sonchifolius]|uniref:Uncharacterized protein n=1 Tax=Smallanthus sonchifolius TaxID=185202 RepID=A0ACB9DFR3_9ASTR|nr:hypothetical protein L1987_58623 [Smallanthus sonchifolius]
MWVPLGLWGDLGILFLELRNVPYVDLNDNAFYGLLSMDSGNIPSVDNRTQYPSVRGVKVVTDANTGRSKGYGFVKFANEMERNRVMTEMSGIYYSTRPMCINAATPKKPIVLHQYVAPKGLYPVTVRVNTSLTNITVYIGNMTLLLQRKN